MAWSIEGRTVLITGGNSGIGKASAAALAKRGADVVITARRSEAGAATAGELSSASGRPVRAMVLDLSDDASIRAFVAEFLQRTDDLGVLINNAGVVLGRRSRTAAGYDLAFQVNHLGPFLLSCLLRDRLIASAPARIVTVSSGAHFSAGGVDLEPQRGIYRAYRAYARSKLANVLFARELDRRLGGLGVRSFSLHPGVVATRIGRDGDTLFGGIALSLMSYRMLSPEQGAATTVYAATDPELDDHGGAYLSGARVSTASALAMDDDLARRLWSVSESVVDCAVPHG